MARATSCSTTRAATRSRPTWPPGSRIICRRPGRRRTDEAAMRIAALVALMAFSLAALAAPKAELWEFWAPSTQSKVAIDHGAWNDFLARNVKAGEDGISRIAYGRVAPA